jgi:hypothetical protein
MLRPFVPNLRLYGSIKSLVLNLHQPRIAQQIDIRQRNESRIGPVTLRQLPLAYKAPHLQQYRTVNISIIIHDYPY